ncbi:Hfi1p [Sugiyamaella lignohabitans]|uniref:Hfi1p n=1 Tax=Sugiyamaella lignohabitans TaxID=796027 RepID=A0A167EZP8_9ASCO|nr:Hfi1p [Sugiyamaella lignohabitans]ANB14643.1 Hfi1p [Sugiyamaella lignohabitans]
MLPKIPFINEKDKAKLQSGGTAASGAAGSGSSAATPASPNKQNKGASPAVDTSSSSSNNNHSLANPMVWTQDIIHSYEAPLASEIYELPDNDSLNARMLGISLEHGLLHGIDNGVCDIMIAGLEHYLKDVVQQIFDKARLRKIPDSANTSIFEQSSPRTASVSGAASALTEPISKRGGSISQTTNPFSAPATSLAGSFEDTMTAEDMAMALDTAPHSFVEMTGPVYRLKNTMLTDEESADPAERPPTPMFNSHIESQPEIANLLKDIMSS